MLTKEEINQFLQQVEPYIKTSSLFAANFFAQNRITHSFWEKTYMQLTPELCEQLYKDLIRDALLQSKIVGFKYGLTVVIYQQADPEAHCGIQLGLAFPFISKS